MAMWQNRPEFDKDNLPYRIHRCPAAKTMKGVIVSDGIIGTALHYWKGRSVPCTHDECTACIAGNKPRWKGYFQMKSADEHTVQIVEITERVYPLFEAAKRKHGSLRGLGVRLSRINGKPNGPLQADFDGIQASDAELPAEANLCDILERMWEQKQSAPPITPEEGDPRGNLPFEMPA